MENQETKGKPLCKRKTHPHIAHPTAYALNYS